MSETETDATDADGMRANDPLTAVVGALAPLIERMDDLTGFAVKYAEEQAVGRPRDEDRVEVRFHQRPERHPMEADHAHAMLRDSGFSVTRTRRGGEAHTTLIITVDVGERDDLDEPEPRPSDPSEQVTLDGGDS